MTKYRVISEPYRLDRFSSTVPTHRRVRGDSSVRRLVTTVEAPDILVALNDIIDLADHRKRSIISIEEVVPAEALYFSDQEITEALSQPNAEDEEALFGEPETLSAEKYSDDEVIYESMKFNDIVESVAKRVSAYLLPGLGLTIISNLYNAYAMVEIRDEATGNYLSTPVDMGDLIQDRSAVGWDGILSIAKALIAAAESLV
jgi:hypothetical protein